MPLARSTTSPSKKKSVALLATRVPGVEGRRHVLHQGDHFVGRYIDRRAETTAVLV